MRPICVLGIILTAKLHVLMKYQKHKARHPPIINCSTFAKYCYILACPDTCPELILLQQVSLFMVLFTAPQLNKVTTHQKPLT